MIVSALKTGQESEKHCESENKWQRLESQEARMSLRKMEGESIRESAENDRVIAIWQREKEERDRQIPQEKNSL